MRAREQIPSLETLERGAERVREHTELLLGAAGEFYRELQDLDAEADGLDPDELTRILVRRSDIAYRLREIDRQLTIGSCELLIRSDPSWATAQRLAADLRSRSNGPWRDLALTLPQPEAEAA